MTVCVCGEYLTFVTSFTTKLIHKGKTATLFVIRYLWCRHMKVIKYGATIICFILQAIHAILLKAHVSPYRAYLCKSLLQLIHFRGSYVCHLYCNYKKITFLMLLEFDLTTFSIFLNFYVQLSCLCWKYSGWRTNTIQLNNLVG